MAQNLCRGPALRGRLDTALFRRDIPQPCSCTHDCLAKTLEKLRITVLSGHRESIIAQPCGFLELIATYVRLSDMRPLSRVQVASQANRQPRPVHPKIRMRRWVKIVGVSAVALLLLVIIGASNTLLFYARVAKLYTQEPETRIAMPLEDVTKRQIADTWDAPRGVGRRHEGQDIFAPKGTPILSATSGYVYKIGENNLGGQT